MKEYYYEMSEESMDLDGSSDTPEEDHLIFFQGYTNSWRQIALATKIYTVAPNICVWPV